MNANRENAKKSSGPRSAAGKAASSRNRLLHGLRANKHILLDEDPAEFLLLIHDHFDRFQPVGLGEENLVLRLAADQWRLYRALPAEAGIYRDRFNDVAHKDKFRLKQWATEKEFAEEDGEPVPPPPSPDEGDLLARAFNVDSEGPNSFARLARYESSIERSIDRCLRQLKTYQAARIASTPEVGQTVPPADPDPPVDGEPVPPAPSAEMPATTPSNDANYHSNPKNEGIAQFSAAAMALMVYALLSAVPKLIAMIGSLLTGPRTASLRTFISSPVWSKQDRRVAVSPCLAVAATRELQACQRSGSGEPAHGRKPSLAAGGLGGRAILPAAGFTAGSGRQKRLLAKIGRLTPTGFSSLCADEQVAFSAGRCWHSCFHRGASRTSRPAAGPAGSGSAAREAAPKGSSRLGQLKRKWFFLNELTDETFVPHKI